MVPIYVAMVTLGASQLIVMAIKMGETTLRELSSTQNIDQSRFT